MSAATTTITSQINTHRLIAFIIFVVATNCDSLHVAGTSLPVSGLIRGANETNGLKASTVEYAYYEYRLKFKDDNNINSKLSNIDNSEELKLRLKLFEENRKFVMNFNQAANRSYDLELNELADWTQDELDSLNGYKKSATRGSSRVTEEEEFIPYISISELERNIPGFLSDDLPEEKDWRRVDGVVGPPGNQGNCGSCWAFSIVGMLEGQEWKLNNTLRNIVQLSQQQLVDCNLEDRGCSGGRFLTALGYIERAGGLQTYLDYPYESGKSGDKTKCRFDQTKAFPSTKYLNGTRRLERGNEDLLKRVVAHYGPVSVAVDSTHKEFKLYSKGIHYNANCTTNFNHSMLIVGYGKSSSGQDYWIVRNSWGKRWGMGGYILMARNRDNNCGIASNPVISLANFPNIVKNTQYV